jgi:hypothetical protein
LHFLRSYRRDLKTILQQAARFQPPRRRVYLRIPEVEKAEPILRAAEDGLNNL